MAVDSLVGKTLGQYQVLDELGQGGMATVYKAWQPNLRRHVALKILQRHLGKDQEFLRRFQQEAIVAANLKHSSIVTIYEVGQDTTGEIYIAMEFIEGQSLEQLIQKQGAIPQEQALQILAQIADALDHAHQRRLVHRDIKPGNIMLTPEGRAVLTDFGIAKAMEGSGMTAKMTTAGTIIGTPAYMSPEEIKGEPVDFRTDLYALGIVAYEMLSGRVPFESQSTATLLYNQVNVPPPDLRQFSPYAPPHVVQALSCMLAKNPQARFPTAGAFIEALRGRWQGMPVQVNPGQTTVMPSDGATVYAGQGQYPPTAPMGGMAGYQGPMGSKSQTTWQTGSYAEPQSAWGPNPQAQPQSGWPTGAPAAPVWSPSADASPQPAKPRKRTGLILAAAASFMFILLLAAGGLFWFLTRETVEDMIARGNEALAAQDYVAAQSAFEDAIRKDDQSAEAYVGLGWVHRHTNADDKALSAFTKAITINPSLPQAHEGQGLSYGRLGNEQAALKALTIWAELEPLNAEAHTTLGWTLYADSKHNEAASAFEKAAALYATPDTYEGLGRSYYALEEYEASALAFREWLLADGDAATAEAYELYGWSLFYLQRYEEAITAFTKALDTAIRTESYRGLAASYYHLEDFEAALQYSEEVIARDPQDAQAQTQIGWSLYRLGQYEEAVSAFTKAVGIEASIEVYQGLSGSYFQLKDYESALNYSREALAFNPRNAQAQARIAWSLHHLGRYEEAVDAFTKAVELEATAGTYQGLASSYFHLKDYEFALNYSREALAFDPRNAQAQARIAWSLHHLGRYEEAVDAFTKAVELEATSGTYQGLASSYFQLKDYESALNYYRESNSLQSNNARVHASIGWCHIHLRDCASARVSLIAALDIDPNLELAQTGLKRCP